MEKKGYKRVYSTYNQVDIAFIKSIFEENSINYYVIGEEVHARYPMAIVMDVMVVSTQAEESRKLIDDFKKKTTDSPV